MNAKKIYKWYAVDTDALSVTVKRSDFCHNSPTIREEPLHRAIVQAINDFYGSSQDISNLLKSSVESTLANIGQTETQRIEHRLKEIDNARNDMIGMIASV